MPSLTSQDSLVTTFPSLKYVKTESGAEGFAVEGEKGLFLKDRRDAKRIGALLAMKKWFLDGYPNSEADYVKEVWTTYLRTMVEDSDSYKWTTKLFDVFPSLQFPYWLIASVSERYAKISRETVDTLLEQVREEYKKNGFYI